MIKRTIIIFVVLCLISVSTFASSPANSGDLAIGLNVSMDITPLSDQQLANLFGGGSAWGCVVATGAWIGLVMGSPVGFAKNPFRYTIMLMSAYMAMESECNIWSW